MYTSRIKTKNIKKPLLCLLFAFAAHALLLSGCQAKNIPAEPVVRTGFFFDTFIQISLYDTDDETILDGCMALASRCEDLFSRTKEGSDIWNINHAAGQAVTVDPETTALLQKALSYCEETDGVFDITIGAVSSLWNFSTEPKGPVPDRKSIEEALRHVDYHGVILDGNTVRLTDPEAVLDLGAIAKGYIADLLKDYLLEQGVKSALINLGGNVLAVGVKPSGEAFQVGIQTPFDAQGTAIEVCSVSDASAVSSGNYERCFEEGGRLYHHILDPETGYPAENDLLGVTIVCTSSADADALSTTCFLLGSDKALSLIEKTDGAEALLITGIPGDISHYRILTSSGW